MQLWSLLVTLHSHSYRTHLIPPDYPIEPKPRNSRTCCSAKAMRFGPAGPWAQHKMRSFLNNNNINNNININIIIRIIISCTFESWQNQQKKSTVTGPWHGNGWMMGENREAARWDLTLGAVHNLHNTMCAWGCSSKNRKIPNMAISMGV